MKVKGKSLMIRLGGHTIALSTSCALECAMNVIDARTKEDPGTNEVPEYISWNISCESLLGLNQGTEQHTYATLIDLFLAKQRVEVEVMLAAGADSAVPAGDWKPGPSAMKGFAPYGGEALIKSLSLTGEARGSAKIRIQLGGQGELRKIDYPLTAHVDGNTLVIDGPVEVVNGELRADKGIEVIKDTITI